MITKINFVKLLFVAYQICMKPAYSTISVTKIEYIGYRNVWHEGDEYHENINVGDPDVIGQSKVLQLCSNECTLAKHECDGFYISKMSEEPINTTCHMVDNNHPRYPTVLQHKIGHGEDTDRIYYVKEEKGTTRFEKPQALVPPCDQDRTTISETDCNTLRSNGKIKYYNCANCTATGCTYLKTVSQIIPDGACIDENRILQCELENENVTANIDVTANAASTDTKHAFLKSFTPGSAQGLIIGLDAGYALEYLELTLKISEGPQEVSRLIIRTLGNDVDQIKKGKVTLFRQNPEGNVTLPFIFEDKNHCVVAINFSDSAFTADDRAIIQNMYKMKIGIEETFGESEAKRGFKADLFIKKKLTY